MKDSNFLACGNTWELNSKSESISILKIVSVIPAREHIEKYMGKQKTILKFM